MSEPLVVRADNGDVVTLTLNRPDKLNALTVALFQELDAHVRALAESKSHVVVLRGAGRAFCAGNDLGDIAAGARPPEPYFQSKVIDRLASLPMPVICAVHGACFTGGLELALAGDLILASESARFGDTHAKWALTPIWGMSQRLPRRVGVAKAKEMMFTCRTYSGLEAEAMGLANACFTDTAFDAEVSGWAAEVAAHSPFSHAANKRLIDQTDGMALAAGLAHEVFRGEGVGPDMQARLAAFSSRPRS